MFAVFLVFVVAVRVAVGFFVVTGAYLLNLVVFRSVFVAVFIVSAGRPAGRPASRPTGRVTGGVPEQSRNLLFFCEGVLEQLSGPRFVVCSLFRCRFSLFFPVFPCFVVAFRRFSLSLPWGSIFFVRSCLHNKK